MSTANSDTLFYLLEVLLEKHTTERTWKNGGYTFSLSHLDGQPPGIMITIEKSGDANRYSDSFSVDANGICGISQNGKMPVIESFPWMSDLQPKGMSASDFIQVCEYRVILLFEFLQKHLPSAR